MISDAIPPIAEGSSHLDSSPFPQVPSHIVGLGASAGGLEAIQQFFDNVPADTGMSFVVVQHLSPDFKSLMGDLLARHTAMPIHLVEDGIAIEANTVYLIPPRRNMVLRGGRLWLSEQPRSEGQLHPIALPIDIFFRSLAVDAGVRAIAIILSGTGSDGSQGVRAVREAGGLVLVQDVESAKFDGMPRSSLRTGVSNHVVPPAEMPSILLRHIRHPRAIPEDEDPDGGPNPGESESEVNEVLALLRTHSDHDFACYKPNTVFRRIMRRVGLRRAGTLREYVDMVTVDPQELDLLYHDLLIGVTHFFRDPEAFAILRDDVIPRLLDQVGGQEELRVWTCGCSTGEEPYGVSILLHDALRRRGHGPRIKLFATDVDRGSLNRAAVGAFPASVVNGVPPELLERYFIRKEEVYSVAPEIRSSVVFSQHNVVKDPPFTKLDLVLCRNLLIYFRPVVQRKILSLFHFALRVGGCLFLGPSETTAELAEEFETIHRTWKIFRKKRDVRLLAEGILPTPPPMGQTSSFDAPRTRLTQEEASLFRAYDTLLERFVPSGLLINDRREVVHVFGDAGRYLRSRSGRATLDVLGLVEENLRLALSAALHRSAREQTSVRFESIPVLDGTTQISLVVEPVLDRKKGAIFTLILLESISRPTPTVSPAELFDIPEQHRQRIEELEHDIRSTQEHLQATIEELETTNEELQSTNEELLASNEELQSSNEELHSVNEELYTVSAEYQKKIEELTQANSDVENLLHSTEIGTIFLDREIRIRKFTAAAAGTITLLNQDIGRPLSHFSHTLKLSQEELLQSLSRVIETGVNLEQEVATKDGKQFLMRAQPYRAQGGEIQGVVLTLIDMTGMHRTREELRQSRARVRSILDSLSDHICVIDREGTIMEVNVAWEKFARANGGTDCSSLGIGANYFQAITTPDLDMVARGLRNVLSGSFPSFTHEYPCHSPTEHRWFLLRAVPLANGSGAVIAHCNITERKLSEQAISRYAAELQRSNRELEQFAVFASHDLQEPLRTLRAFAADLPEDLGRDLPEEARKDLDFILDSSARMSQLIEGLLELSRAGRKDRPLTPCDLSRCAAQALEAVSARASEVGAQVQIAPLPEVMGDESALVQLFQNLLGNALKFHREVPPEVQIACEPRGEGWEVQVRDNGIGIESVHAERIFAPFQRLHTTREFEGTGIGLAICRKVVERHGGRIWVESQPGRGSSFHFVLPRQPLLQS